MLAGGRGSRLGGVDKASLRWEGRALLDRVIDSLDASHGTEVVVVGSPRPTDVAVSWVREEPAYAGPAAAVLAGLAALRDARGLVAIAAVDMPHLSVRTWERLYAAAPGRDGAVLVSGGHRHLALVADGARLRALRADEDPVGRSVRWLLGGLDLAEVEAEGAEVRDVDTPADLEGDLGGSAHE